MRKPLMVFVILMTCVGFLGCGEDGLPDTRVTNETDEEVNISFKQGTDPTMNINGTQPGAMSAFREIREGDTLVTGLPDKEDGMVSAAERGSDYTVVVRTNNSKIEISGQ